MMAQLDEFMKIFEELKSILVKYEDRLIQGRQGEGDYHLNTSMLMKKGDRLYFGGVEIRKSYVSFYLMPIYCCPEMTELISPELLQRMQGKSCFNFKKYDQALFDQIAVLTEHGFQRFNSGEVRERLAQF